MTVLERFSRKATLAYARAREPRNYVGRALFPDKYVNELTFEYWKDLNLLPVMASVQAFGAEAEQASREGVERVEGAIPTIKRKIPLTGRALLALRREGAGDEEMVADILYNDLDNMIDAVQARVEAMRIEALHSGKLVLEENGVKMTVDYGVPSAHQTTLTGDDKWSNPESSPIQFMLEWVQTVRAATGIVPTRALTSSEVIMHLLKNTEIRQLIYGDLGGSRAITRAQLDELLVQMELPRLLAYDEMVRRQKADGTYETIRFLPSNKFILLPGEPVGETLIGPTEDAMLDADIETREMAGIYAAVYRETMDPPVIFTKAAICAIPTFPLADAVFQATVL